MLRRISSVGALALLSFPTVFAASSNPTCPESHGTEYTSSNGNIYQIVCGTDTKGNDISHVEIHSNRIADCVSRCDATAGCTDITMSGTTCYMKGKAGPASTCSDCSAARLVGSANSSSSSVTSTSVSVASLSTSSQSMTAAPSTTSISTTDNGTEYIRYSTVGGYFLQDLNATNASTFDYTATNFGLINQTYSTDCGAGTNLTQWQRFNRVLFELNQQAASNVVYKLLFIGRHGEGYHNAAESFYGTPAWNCYYSELIGNGTTTWADADLTVNGIAQAQTANRFWATSLRTQHLAAPQSFYVSPLTRCLKTANLTYASLPLSPYYPFIPTVKEFLREGISTHTCDHRRSKSYIQSLFPTWRIEPQFTQNDTYWNGVTAETSSAQDYRSKIALDSIFAGDAADVVSITTHSGEAASLLRVLQHRVFGLVTGAIIPVLVRAETVRITSMSPTTTSSQPWTASSWCTNGPPISSATTGCMCSGGVAPVATLLPGENGF